MASITVPATFMADWNYFCDRAGLDRFEQGALREDVRRDFATVGGWVVETAAVYRFCDATWGRLPTPELCRGYLASLRWFAEDETIFVRCGVLVLAKLCWQVTTQGELTT